MRNRTPGTQVTAAGPAAGADFATSSSPDGGASRSVPAAPTGPIAEASDRTSRVGPRPDVSAKSSLRGSSGMLVGYVASQLINFIVQVGTVRYLTKSEYGAFAWALSAVLLVQAILPLGLDRASARFLAMYDERRDYARLFGLIAIELIVVLGFGSVAVGSTWLLSESLEAIAPSNRAVAILVILIALAPIQALDIIVVEMFAVFASPWSVFLRRYVMEPLLRLCVVALLVMQDADGTFLAVGFTVVGAIGLVLYLFLLVRLFRKVGLATHFSLRKIILPWREVIGFCGPVMLTSLVAVATTEFAAFYLGHARGVKEVATFRAVLPFAVLNLGVLYTFTTLFTPSASRLIARGARDEVRELYWQSACWISVLTFPVLGATTAFAAPFTLITLGGRYESSALVLLILSFGYYINAAFGFNGYTVQMLGRSSYVLLTNVVTLATMVVATILLVGEYGAVGAALSVLITLTVHNLLKQMGLGFGAGVGVFQREHSLVLLQVVAAIGLLLAVDRLLHPDLWVGLVLVLVAWMVLLRSTRNTLRLTYVFPEVAKIPVVRWLLKSEVVSIGPQTDSDAGVAGQSAPLRNWRLIDWRFLLPPGVARVGYIGGVSGEEAGVLVESGVELVADPVGDAGSCDVVVVTSGEGEHVDAGYRAADRTGGWLLVRLGLRRSTAWSRVGRRSVGTWTKRLSTPGQAAVRAYWHAPNEQRCSYLVNLADRVAVDAMLRRYEGVRFGRQKSWLTRFVNRVGLVHLIARDVTLVVDCRPPSTPRQPSEPFNGPTPSRSTPAVSLPTRSARAAPVYPSAATGVVADGRSVLLITPWFEASRHVVALYIDAATARMEAVAKFPRRRWDSAGISVEAAALRAVIERSPALVGHVPVIEQVASGDRPYLLETALSGHAVDPRYVRRNRVQVLRAGMEFVAKLAVTKHSDDDPGWFERTVESPLRQFAHSVELEETAEVVARTLELLEPLRSAQLPLVFEHGDLGHPNLMMDSTGDMSALDWERFNALGLPAHDLVFLLQYLGEAEVSAVERREQKEAFDDAFVGKEGWAAPLLREYAIATGVDPGLLPLLILASWARTSTSLLDRLTPTQPAEAAKFVGLPTKYGRHSMRSDRVRLRQPPEGPSTGGSVAGLTEAVSADRDYELWRHCLDRFHVLLA